MRDAVGGAEPHGDLGEAGAARGAVGGHEDGVLGRAPVDWRAWQWRTPRRRRP